MSSKIIPTGHYEAQLTRISLNERGDILSGASVWLWLPAVKQTVKYYVKPAEEDLSLSLKELTYFLDYPFKGGRDYNPKNLIGRQCQLKIQSISSAGRRYPRIDGFAFSDLQLFQDISDGK